jgi:hypothetical protein
VELESVFARLRHPTWSAARWYEAYREARRAMRRVRTDPFDHRTFDRAYDLHVYAIWALMSFRRKALPFALELLKSPSSDDRANATSILQAAADDPAAIEALVRLVADRDLETRDAAIVALGRTKAETAVPALATILRDDDADGDTRDAARVALGQIVGRRFPSVDAAVAWLRQVQSLR